MFGQIQNPGELNKLKDTLTNTEALPVLFIGHGSPTNALEQNEFVESWKMLAKKLPVPQAILCISAHWETNGTFVTAMQNPPTIHDFGGFARELYEIQYNAEGFPELAANVKENINHAKVDLDYRWGLDHGCWVPLLSMYPKADIPVIQLSLDYSKNAEWHYSLAKELAFLRKKGVLIIGSGNMVHNLRMMRLESFSDINKEFGFDWALEMNSLFKDRISTGNHLDLIRYESLGSSAKLAIPTPEHYLPLLYTLALQEKGEIPEFFNDKAVAGSLTMTSVIIRKE
jgi:4,5-DOPA dioxygenase extradiol